MRYLCRSWIQGRPMAIRPNELGCQELLLTPCWHHIVSLLCIFLCDFLIFSGNRPSVTNVCFLRGFNTSGTVLHVNEVMLCIPLLHYLHWLVLLRVLKNKSILSTCWYLYRGNHLCRTRQGDELCWTCSKSCLSWQCDKYSNTRIIFPISQLQIWTYIRKLGIW